jgi:hypothetical protein
MFVIFVGGLRYEVAVVDDLGGPLSLVLPGIVFVVDSGNSAANLEHAIAVLHAVAQARTLL